MSCCNDITVTVQNNPHDNIVVYIDEKGVGIKPILNFISVLSSNFNIQQEVTTTMLNNSANWQETFNDVNIIQDTLSATWRETYDEVNIIQNTLSAGWQETFEYFESGVINGGFF